MRAGRIFRPQHVPTKHFAVSGVGVTEIRNRAYIDVFPFVRHFFFFRPFHSPTIINSTIRQREKTLLTNLPIKTSAEYSKHPDDAEKYISQYTGVRLTWTKDNFSKKFLDYSFEQSTRGISALGLARIRSAAICIKQQTRRVTWRFVNVKIDIRLGKKWRSRRPAFKVITLTMKSAGKVDLMGAVCFARVFSGSGAPKTD